MKVAVLGCGLIGASWAALFSAIGSYEVSAWDPDSGARDGFANKVRRARKQLQALGASGEGEVRVCDKLDDAVRAAHWIQENAPEKLELKLQLYGRIGRVMERDAIVASSTSSFTWSQLAADLSYGQRFVIAHPFNPPHLIPLVELFCPSPGTLEHAVAFFRSIGRVPVCLKREATGHIGNRLASALWREAVNIVAEGIADVADVDNVLVHGPGLRWSIVGTHMGYHLGGGEGGIEHYLHHLGPSQERRWASLGNPRLTPEVCDLLVQGVRAQAAGRSIAQLEMVRDARLMDVLRTRQLHSSSSMLESVETSFVARRETDTPIKKPATASDDRSRTSCSLTPPTEPRASSRPRIALVHALAESVQPIHDAFERHWPDAIVFDLLDSSLAPDLASAGKLEDGMIERFLTLGRYAERTCGADAPTAAILFTCSAFGAAIEAVKQSASIPVLRPNEAAFESALAIGGRVGLLVTFAPSLPALRAELQSMAEERGIDITVVARVVEGALDALKRGDAATHDRLVAEAAARMPMTDSLILGQFSLARAAAAIEPVAGRKIITTPASAVAHLRELLANGATGRSAAGID